MFMCILSLVFCDCNFHVLTLALLSTLYLVNLWNSEYDHCPLFYFCLWILQINLLHMDTRTSPESGPIHWHVLNHSFILRVFTLGNSYEILWIIKAQGKTRLGQGLEVITSPTIFFNSTKLHCLVIIPMNFQGKIQNPNPGVKLPINWRFRMAVWKSVSRVSCGLFILTAQMWGKDTNRRTEPSNNEIKTMSMTWQDTAKCSEGNVFFAAVVVVVVIFLPTSDHDWNCDIILKNIHSVVKMVTILKYTDAKISCLDLLLLQTLKTPTKETNPFSVVTFGIFWACSLWVNYCPPIQCPLLNRGRWVSLLPSRLRSCLMNYPHRSHLSIRQLCL